MEGTAPKGILKNSGEMPEKTMGIKWDEDIIAEHDKDRGKCMKIIEPKTPYEVGAEP